MSNRESTSTRKPARPRSESDSATRRKVLDAAVDCILERGFYRASSNEIARRAGVTWGVIQHHFGTREALMLAVLEDGAQKFVAIVADATIDGSSTAKRVDQLLDVLVVHYGSPAYLAYLQILLNMDHDPKTSAEVRTTMRTVAEQSNTHLRRLLRDAVGSAPNRADLATTLFLVLRGFALSQQLLDTMAYDAVPTGTDRERRQRTLLSQMIGTYLDHLEPAGS